MEDIKEALRDFAKLVIFLSIAGVGLGVFFGVFYIVFNWITGGL